MRYSDAATQLSRTHAECVRLILGAIMDIPDEQFWRNPSSESRSICEMIRHLIRVDIWFMSQFGFELNVEDPGDLSAADISTVLMALNREIDEIISNNTTILVRTPKGHKKIRHSFAEVILHMCHHWLYHYAQVVYLRRAEDRTWSSNLQEWDQLTYSMGMDSAMINILLDD